MQREPGMDAVSLNPRVLCLAGIALAACAATLALVPAIPQDPGYHQFADRHGRLGIPNFFNVVSNLPFLLVGLAGLRDCSGRSPPGMPPRLRPAYLMFFAAVALIGPGSAYYHWAPSNSTLLWDRLPMTVAFMAFLVIIIAEYISEQAGRRLLWPLVITGAASVLYWAFTESRGQGDLRPYALVQFLPLVLIPLILLWFPSRFDGSVYIWGVLLAYLAAKLAEWMDAPVFGLLQPVSGHTLKHLLAALGTYGMLLRIRRRHGLKPARAGQRPENISS